MSFQPWIANIHTMELQTFVHRPAFLKKLASRRSKKSDSHRSIKVQVSSSTRPTAPGRREMIDSVQDIDDGSKHVCQIMENITGSRSGDRRRQCGRVFPPATKNSEQVITQLTNHSRAVRSPIQVEKCLSLHQILNFSVIWCLLMIAHQPSSIFFGNPSPDS